MLNTSTSSQQSCDRYLSVSGPCANKMAPLQNNNKKAMSVAVPAFTESGLRRDITYLERTLTRLDGNPNDGAKAAYARAVVQLRRRRKQLRALLARDFRNWPRYSDDPLDVESEPVAVRSTADRSGLRRA